MLYPIVFLGIRLINIGGAHILAMIMKVPMEIYVETGALLCMAEWTGIVVLGMYGVINRRRIKAEQGLNPGQFVILLAGVIGMLGVVAVSQAFLFDREMTSDMRLWVINVAAMAALLFIGLSFGNCATWKRAYRYQMENEMYAHFVEEQENCIHNLIIEDEKRRRLKHDMSAHMQAMNSMVQSGQMTELKEYIASMEEKLGGEQERCYTSVVAVDAVIAGCEQVARERGVTLQWDGRIIPQNKVSVFELCTIFFNLLSNAVEAAAQTEKKEIFAMVNIYQEMLVISIRNSCKADVKSSDVRERKKGDPLYHGLGHKNVEEIVDKHIGKISYDVKDGMFGVVIVL